MTPSSEKTKTFEITIDGDPYEISDKQMTAHEILELTGKSPEAFYLVEVRGKKERESYKDKLDQAVNLHQGSKFVLVSTGETPVS